MKRIRRDATADFKRCLEGYHRYATITRDPICGWYGNITICLTCLLVETLEFESEVIFCDGEYCIYIPCGSGDAGKINELNTWEGKKVKVTIQRL